MDHLMLLSTMSINLFERRCYIKANNKFSIIIFNEVLKHHQDSFFLSPPLLESSLMLLVSGSRKKTAREIVSALRLSNNRKVIKAIRLKMKTFQYYSIKFSNKLYINEDIKVKDEFNNVAAEVHEATTENIDFSKPDRAVQKINEWVERDTGQLIPHLLNGADVANVTDAVLINVAHFRASWACPFLLANTKRGVFIKNGYEVIEVDVMISKDKYYNYNDSYKLQAKFLEIPFVGDDASMTFVLPNKADGLPELEKRIGKVFSFSSLYTEAVNVSLPKFKMTSKHLFKTALQNLGVLSVFRADRADLSDLVENKSDLAINEIIQGVTIDVSEEGVGSATAAAVLVPVPRRSETSRKLPKNFVVDRPFLFYIKIRKAIICAGRISVPEQGTSHQPI